MGFLGMIIGAVQAECYEQGISLRELVSVANHIRVASELYCEQTVLKHTRFPRNIMTVKIALLLFSTFTGLFYSFSVKPKF